MGQIFMVNLTLFVYTFRNINWKINIFQLNKLKVIFRKINKSSLE